MAEQPTRTGTAHQKYSYVTPALQNFLMNIWQQKIHTKDKFVVQ